MLVRFWGVRGSIGTAITHNEVQAKIRQILQLASPADILSRETVDNFISNLPFSLRGTYGGNTTCIEVNTGPDDKDILIIDAGTGLRGLGNSLFGRDRMKGKDLLTFLMTHTHWDHIQGLPFFGPIYVPGNTVNFISSFDDIEERLRYQQVRTHFPVGFDEMGATKSFAHFPEGSEYEVYDLKITSKSVRHPGGCYSYRLQQGDKSFIFCSDAEFNLETMEDIGPYIEYFTGADVLVFDTQYTFEESLQKIDWGHSSAAIATDIAIKSNVKKLILYHHDPTYDDNKMDAVTLQAMKYKDMMAPSLDLDIQTAYEGLEIRI
ncbi:MAG: MBL fold metallo-hydrolase [Leptospiraceae bacterium]|nr:MBL fold metallo-hydrolase [Leptospiraceae bacterium]